MNSSTAPYSKAISSRYQQLQQNFQKKHPHAHNFFLESGIDLGHIRQHSTKLLTAGTMMGAVLLMPPGDLTISLPSLPEVVSRTFGAPQDVSSQETRVFLAEQLKKVIPKLVCPLSFEQERQIGFLVEKLTGIRARASLEGEHLNVCFGLIGAEQHLKRYPGDTLSQHEQFQKSGVAPGLGAWGYFAKSQAELTPADINREKYYVAVQTLYLPDWNRRVGYLRDWYKYRKVLVLNPQNGQSVVAVIADAGPAAWTGKHFGGSPEVMAHLELNKGMQKGPVLVFFVDDPENKVPLGPVEYPRGKIDLKQVSSQLNNV